MYSYAKHDDLGKALILIDVALFLQQIIIYNCNNPCIKQISSDKDYIINVNKCKNIFQQSEVTYICYFIKDYILKQIHQEKEKKNQWHTRIYNFFIFLTRYF